MVGRYKPGLQWEPTSFVLRVDQVNSSWPEQLENSRVPHQPFPFCVRIVPRLKNSQSRGLDHIHGESVYLTATASLPMRLLTKVGLAQQQTLPSHRGNTMCAFSMTLSNICSKRVPPWFSFIFLIDSLPEIPTVERNQLEWDERRGVTRYTEIDRLCILQCTHVSLGEV